MSERTKKKIVPFIFLAPFLILFLVFMVYPTISSIVMSFSKYRQGQSEFVGLANFQFVLKDPIFRKAIINTFVILIIQVPIQTLLCVVFASFLNIQTLKLKGLYRMFVFMPVLIDTVSYSIVFKLLFNNSETAIVNSLFGLIGMGPVDWFNQAWPAKIMLILAVTWRWTGYNTVIILGGLQNISADLYEAASIDGASKIKQFFSITIPGVKPVLTYSVILSVNGILQLFAEPNLITKGGPINETLTIVQYLYNNGFKTNNFGVASAGAYVLAIMIAILTFIQMRLTKEED